jgi:hypothetical protein
LWRIERRLSSTEPKIIVHQLIALRTFIIFTIVHDIFKMLPISEMVLGLYDLPLDFSPSVREVSKPALEGVGQVCSGCVCGSLALRNGGISQPKRKIG